MSEDDDFEVPEGYLSVEDAEEMAASEAAAAINSFLWLISLGYKPETAFERALPMETRTSLRVPSNLRIEMLP